MFVLYIALDSFRFFLYVLNKILSKATDELSCLRRPRGQSFKIRMDGWMDR